MYPFITINIFEYLLENFKINYRKVKSFLAPAILRTPIGTEGVGTISLDVQRIPKVKQL